MAKKSPMPDQAKKHDMPPGQRKKIDAAIAHRLTIAREDAETMRTKADYIGMRGGPHPLFARCEFHEGRVALLEWMQTASLDEINAKIETLEAELGRAVALKGGSMLYLQEETVQRIAHLELLEYAVGIHASQQRVA